LQESVVPALACKGAPPFGDKDQSSQLIGGKELWLRIKLNGMQTALDLKVNVYGYTRDTCMCHWLHHRVIAYDALDPSMQDSGTAEQK